MLATPRHTPVPLLVLATATALLLTGCSTSTPTAAQSASTPVATPPARAVDAPLPAATMICASETQHNVARIFTITHPVKPASTWTDNLYTCTYHTPDGTLRLSVKESATPTAARAYFDQQQKNARTPETITGLENLGLPAYETPTGEVSFVKDNMTLLVNASQLHRTGQTSPTQLAYETATDILGCWNG